MPDKPEPDEEQDRPEDEDEDISGLPDITIPATRGSDSETFEEKSK